MNTTKEATVNEPQIVDASTIYGRRGNRGGSGLAAQLRAARQALTPGKAVIINLDGRKPETLRAQVINIFGAGAVQCFVQPDGTYAIVLRDVTE